MIGWVGVVVILHAVASRAGLRQNSPLARIPGTVGRNGEEQADQQSDAELHRPGITGCVAQWIPGHGKLTLTVAFDSDR
jgi:hypothetical protein